MSVATYRDAARQLAQGAISPGAAARDEERRFPRAELLEMGRLGFLGMLVPEAYGGAGLSHETFVAAVEEVAAADGVCAMIMVSQNTLANRILLDFGNESQKTGALAALARGEKLCAFAMSEPQSGSDAFRMRTTAERHGDDYLLTGTKQFVTVGSEADFALVIAVTDAKKKPIEAFSAFLVPTDAPGYGRGKREETFGMRSSDTRQVHFDRMPLPAAWRVGAEGAGYEIATKHLGRSRVGIAAQALGIARAARAIAAKYATERQAFGKPIVAHQAVAFRLADMSIKLHAARLMIEDAARRLDEGLECMRECSMAKLFASEAAETVTHDAMQVLGGYGYLREFGVERLYRDARVCSIYEGTSDILRILLANAIIDDVRGC